MFDDEGSRGEFLKILAEMGEEPAFIERARAPEDALKRMLQRCVAGRAEFLQWPRRHYTMLRKRIRDDWGRLESLVADTDAGSMFVALAADLPTIDCARPPLFATDRSLLRNFLESAMRFNGAWERFLGDAGIDHVNQLRENYNQFYSMEKSCAFGLETIADDFTPLSPLSPSFLITRFPLLNIPTLVR